jgi:hypothetical protein
LGGLHLLSVAKLGLYSSPAKASGREREHLCPPTRHWRVHSSRYRAQGGQECPRSRLHAIAYSFNSTEIGFTSTQIKLCFAEISFIAMKISFISVAINFTSTQISFNSTEIKLICVEVSFICAQ